MSDDFELWDVLVSVFWFMLLVAWISLLFKILGDLFRDRTLGGGTKAAWVVLLVFLPWLGALLYLVFRGSSMHERDVEAAQERDAELRAYVRDVTQVQGPSAADELRKLAELRDSNAITSQDYDLAKAKILA